MMMTLDVTHSTFPHRRDLDLDRRPDLDRSAAGVRNKRLRSDAELTSSSSSSCRSRDVLEHCSGKVEPAAPSRGPFSKLKLKLVRTKSINKPETAANNDATTEHVDKHGGEFNSTDKSTCLEQLTSVDSKQSDNEVTSVNPAVSSEQTVQKKGFQRSVSVPAEQVNVRAPVNFRPGDEYFDFPCKFHCPQQQFQFVGGVDSPQAKLKCGKLVGSFNERGEADGASINTPLVTDRSPLIKNATSPPPLIADATAFDNAAVAEPTQETTSASGRVTSNVDRKLSDSPPEVGRNVVGKEASTTARSTTSKKRKVLSIIIPSKESSSSGGMRQLSAAEERKLDEAMQLASSFARLAMHHDHTDPLTPRSTASGSSKESLDSPGPGATGGHVFRFGGLRRRVTGKEEKRTFVDGLSLTCNATDIFTPDAQAAYNQLVSVSPVSATSTVTTKLPSRRDARRAHRPVPDLPVPRPSALRRRSAATPTLQAAFSTISRTTHTLSTPDGRARIGYQRSSSLTEESVMSGARSAHRIDLRSISSSDSTLSPTSAKTPHTEDDILASPPLHRAPAPPPPALPPRIPLRPTTRGPKPRPHLPPKQRSMSEAQRPVQSGPSTDVALPRRATRCASETAESRCSEGLDTTDILDSTRDSNDSVFASSSSSNNDKPEKEADNDDETTPREQEPASTARLNVADLGFYDPVDTFWNRRVDFDQATLSRSAQDLLEELDQSTTSTSCGPQGLGSSDAVSYEDLMEFALDGPRHRVESEDGECDEVRLMRKLLPADVTVDECMDALSETQWDVHNAIKLIKLGQLLSTGLADKQTCKRALMSCQWNVPDAATFLLNGQQGHAADI